MPESKMRINWWRLSIFGVCIGVPFVWLTEHKKQADRVALLKGHRQEMGECATCYRLLRHKVGISFIMHLQDYHKIQAEDSYTIVGDLWRKVLAISKEEKKV
jgi:hypothetical protein